MFPVRLRLIAALARQESGWRTKDSGGQLSVRMRCIKAFAGEQLTYGQTITPRNARWQEPATRSTSCSASPPAPSPGYIYLHEYPASSSRAAATAAWSSNNPSFVSKFIAHKQAGKGYAKRMKRSTQWAGGVRTADTDSGLVSGLAEPRLWQYKSLLRNLQKANKRFDTWIALTARIRQGQSPLLAQTKDTVASHRRWSAFIMHWEQKEVIRYLHLIFK